MRHLAEFTSVVAITLALATPAARAEPLQVAVAANFAAPMQALAASFEKTTGHSLTLVVGSTGKLYAQIQNGAPFGVLLAADTTTPQKLEQQGLGLAGTRFVFATGKLVLWSADASRLRDPVAELKAARFQHLAIANPAVAPYGAAARQVLAHLDLEQTLAPLIVQGEDITQTFQFVKTGNAELGFVALSQVYRDDKIQSGSGWIVPTDDYSPLAQEAIALKAGTNNPDTTALLDFLRSPAAKNLIRSYGYDVAP